MPPVRTFSTEANTAGSNPARTSTEAAPTSIRMTLRFGTAAKRSARTTRAIVIGLVRASVTPRALRRRVMPSLHAQCRTSDAENPRPSQKSSALSPLARQALTRSRQTSLLATPPNLPEPHPRCLSALSCSGYSQCHVVLLSWIESHYGHAAGIAPATAEVVVEIGVDHGPLRYSKQPARTNPNGWLKREDNPREPTAGF
jgi:hypothetical protein